MTAYIANLPPVVLLLIVTGVAAAGGLVPFSPTDPLLVGIATMGRPMVLAAAVLLATAGQMATKALLFRGSARAQRALSPRKQAALDATSRRLQGRPGLQTLTVFASALAGIPPLYLVTIICGALGLRLRRFLLAASVGRVLRFAALVMVPQLLFAQQPVRAVVEQGAGAETYVLLSGLVGGTAAFRQVAPRLVAQGYRVIVVDPYLLSIDSADVSFAALARRVDRELQERGVRAARMVGHAHGAGVMLRVAAMSPDRVSELYFLDVGALAVNRSKVFSASLKLVPIITRIPGGREFVRDRFVKGLRENAGSSGWLDAEAQRAYTGPFLDNLDRVIAMGDRLNRALEPEPLASVVARIRVPATVILGQAPRATRPDPVELEALAPLGTLLRVERFAGVGHFPHEEAPDELVRVLVAPRPTVVARVGSAQ